MSKLVVRRGDMRREVRRIIQKYTGWEDTDTLSFEDELIDFYRQEIEREKADYKREQTDET